MSCGYNNVPCPPPPPVCHHINPDATCGGGNLPYTGADLLLYVAIGLSLLAAGLALWEWRQGR